MTQITETDLMIEDFDPDSYILHRKAEHVYKRARIGQAFYLVAPIGAALVDNLYSERPLDLMIFFGAFVILTLVRFALKAPEDSEEALDEWMMKSRLIHIINTSCFALGFSWFLYHGYVDQLLIVGIVSTFAYSTGNAYVMSIDKPLVRLQSLIFFVIPSAVLFIQYPEHQVVALVLLTYCVFLFVCINVWSQEFMNFIELEVDSQRLKHALIQQSLTDTLTGLANRRHYTAFLRQAYDRAVRNKSPLSLLLIDLDHFKKINDTHGHGVGDLVLQQVARIIKKTCKRKVDMIARIGGEEFAIVFPDTKLEHAEMLAERLQVEFERFQERSVEELPSVTFSAGVGEYIPERDGTPDDLFIRVDQAGFAAKKNGRNRVERALT